MSEQFFCLHSLKSANIFYLPIQVKNIKITVYINFTPVVISVDKKINSKFMQILPIITMFVVYCLRFSCNPMN